MASGASLIRKSSTVVVSCVRLQPHGCATASSPSLRRRGSNNTLHRLVELSPTSSLRRSASSSKTNDNSVAILLTYGTARLLLAGDAEAREEYMARGPYRDLKRSLGFTSTKVPDLRFRALLTEGGAE